MPKDPEGTQPVDRYYLLVLAVGVVALWIWPLRSSFWLDETVTAWVVQGSFSQMVHRSLQFQAISPFYYGIAWLTRDLFGFSELALRFPSVLAGAGATYLLYRLGRRFFDRETGVIAAVVFAASVGGSYAVGDARPYALTLLALIGFTAALANWLDSGRWTWGAATIVLGVLVPYLHYVYVAAMPAHALYAWRRSRSERRVSTLALSAATTIALVLLLPLAPHLLTTAQHRGILSQGRATIGSIVAVLFPPVLVGGLLLGIAVAALQERVTARWPLIARNEFVLLVGWAISPPLVLAISSWIGGVGFFTNRYLLSGLPAQALLAAGAIGALSPRGVRRATVAMMAIVSLLAIGTLEHRSDTGAVGQWREAIAEANRLADPSTPVLVRPAFVESANVTLDRDPMWIPYLLAPVEVYPLQNQPLLLPYGTSRADQLYMNNLVETNLATTSRFVLIMRLNDPVLDWIEGRTASLGFTVSSIHGFGFLGVVVFERSALAR